MLSFIQMFVSRMMETMYEGVALLCFCSVYEMYRFPLQPCSKLLRLVFLFCPLYIQFLVLGALCLEGKYLASIRLKSNVLHDSGPLVISVFVFLSRCSVEQLDMFR